MKKLLLSILLIVGCAVNLGHNPILTLNIATKQSEKSCLKECEMYLKLRDESNIDLEINPKKDAFCICMTNCIALDSSYCLIDSVTISP